jgi:hypothetical protein
MLALPANFNQQAKARAPPCGVTSPFSIVNSNHLAGSCRAAIVEI